MIILPIGHEKMSARRWPIVTLALIAINVIAFLLTQSFVTNESGELALTRAHIRLLVALHPELTQPPEAQELVAAIEKNDPKGWAYIKEQNLNYPIQDGWDARMRLSNDSLVLQEEMNTLCAHYASLRQSSQLEKYAFVPAHPTPLSYVTANFLHGGWLHLIFNMWFLGLAGLVLEDRLGRVIYLLFYLLAGAAALQFQAWISPASLVPTLGASGAVAGLMGAFLILFPTLKIKIVWLLLFRPYRFDVAAIWLLPLWLLNEIFNGSTSGSGDGVAHWAHVGGLVFGALVALLLRFTGLEHKVNDSIEAKVNKVVETNDAAIIEAGDLMEHGRLDDALPVLQTFAAANPRNMDACRLTQQIYWRKGNLSAYQEQTVKLCGLHLRAQEPEIAWQEYKEYVNSGGGQLPAATWLDLCRGAETLQNFDLALSEYQKLIAAYPSERQSVMAQIAAGKLCLKKLARPQDALKFYEAASASSVPHLDLDINIDAGIREAKASVLSPTPAVAK